MVVAALPFGAAFAGVVFTCAPFVTAMLVRSYVLIVPALARGALACLPRLVTFARVVCVRSVCTLACFMFATLAVAPGFVPCFGFLRLSRRNVVPLPAGLAAMVPACGPAVVIAVRNRMTFVLAPLVIAVSVMSASMVGKGAATQQRDGKKTCD